MTDFVQAFSAQVDVTTIEPAYVRPAVILVRPGNPLKIKRFADLLRPRVRTIIVQGSGQTGLWDVYFQRSNLVSLLVCLSPGFEEIFVLSQ
jgi:accessory colonization factor AcfC